MDRRSNATGLSDDRLLQIEKNIREAGHVNEIWTTPADVTELITEVRWWRAATPKRSAE